MSGGEAKKMEYLMLVLKIILIFILRARFDRIRPSKKIKLVIFALLYGASVTYAYAQGRYVYQPTIELTTHVDTHTPYVQAQVRYRVILYYANSLTHVHLSKPRVDDAMVLRLGQDIHKSIWRSGRHYGVLERDYAIFPQKSGALKIYPPKLDANRLSKRGKTLERIHRAGDPVFLNVRPIPAVAKRMWLPAMDVQVTQTWPKHEHVWHVGDVIKRHIVVRAQGLLAVQLPKLGQMDITGMNRYADASHFRDRIIHGKLLGEREENIVYIPQQTGTLYFPNLQLSWWNVSKSRFEQVNLSSKTVRIVPVLSEPFGSHPPEPRLLVNITQMRTHVWLYDAMLMVLISLGLAWWMRHDYRERSGWLWPIMRFVMSMFYLVVCLGYFSNPKAVRHIVLKWGAWHHNQKLTHVMALAHGDASWRRALSELDRALYHSPNSWEGFVFWRAMCRHTCLTC